MQKWFFVMKDETKHIIAKEIIFFFKWALIGGAIAVASWLLHLAFNNENIDTFFAIVFWMGVCMPLLAYAYRGLKWLIRWIIKWK